MSASVMARPTQASVACTGYRAATPMVILPRTANRLLRGPCTGGGMGLPHLQQRGGIQVLARKDDRKAEPGVQPTSSDPSSSDVSPFFEPLLRGLVLGIGAGILCELAHVAFKVTNIASDGGFHLPSAAQLYEQLAPLFVWDHAVAIFFWLVFYVIEAGAILAILREYPDDKQAFRVIRSTPTLPKRLMPLKLSSAKRAIHSLIHGRSPQAAHQGAAPLAFRGDAGAPTLPGPRPSATGGGGGAGTSLLDRPRQPPLDLRQRQQQLERQLGAAEAAEVSERQREPGSASDSSSALGGSASAASRQSAGLRPGQLDPASPLLGGRNNAPLSKSAKREKELADRRAYLQNFWYAAALSDKVDSTPLKVDILSRTVTLWRGEDGKVHCLDNVCPHRGAPLSSGWSKTAKNGKSCVVCPYHGWAFNGEGALEEVPSQNAHTSFPRRPVVDSYPVEERGGFVWLFFGSKNLPEDERPPLPLVPELEDPNWRPVYGEMEFNCPHWSVFENALDMAHIHYLHNGSFGNQDKPVINDMKVTRDTWSVSANFSIHNKPVNPLWNFSRVDSVPVEARGLLPSTSYVKITLGGGIQMITYVNTVPIDEHRSINRFCLIRNFALNPIFDNYTRKNMYKILTEDKVMIELLKPEQLAEELSLEADRPQIAFRKLRQEWIDMGYGVAPERLNGHDGSLRLDM
ncbi:hypothetical protein PLESTB_001326400 [Pleodorina starrii]|uniref:Rieske domain-containing protein n=1 Tax=Pleodorina starrii TaxID=330485 RepID=A0A9W6F6J6_9CHLO|nr:hypothetical protein PLESTM_001622200 [Pleodorina starrii]GLC58169.1 hypothetical protein PLESTB_001326400 [Pleodorina starrii]GLC75563.1 hypothetical protein PLESTF_001657500 [Pleodorina starrii]